jgi:hypothetical protein
MTRRSVRTWTAALIAVVWGVAGYSVAAGASRAVPHAERAANVTLPPSLVTPVLVHCQTQPIDTSPACTRSLLAEINYGLSSEGLGPIALPSNWASDTVAEQIFVIVDLERVARGLQPFSGLSFIWNVDAEIGAFAPGDPPISGDNSWIAAEWAGGTADVSPLAADYAWMYDDGFPGPNIGCTSAGAVGCWAHRAGILGAGSCTTCVAGAGYAVAGGASSMTAVFVEPTGAPPPLAFTWAGNVAPFLGAAVPTVSAAGSMPSTGGYREVGRDGGVFALGATYDGSMGGRRLDAPVVGMAADARTGGYREVAADGGVFNFNAPYYGSMGGQRLDAPIVGIAADPWTGG